jgi:NAD(P)-dependent dehydrogenase (short-subunit alcohol dehydrogenase family)
MTSLVGRAIVTGAASGIGRATAERLRDEGVDVLAVDRDPDGLSTLDGVDTLVIDLTSESDRDRLVLAGTGTNYLVNSAGIIRLKPILDFTAQDIRDIYSVNVEALWDLTSRIGRTIPSGGAIVNLSSISAKLPTTLETAVYASSKASVVSITRSFSYAFAGAGVRVNAVCPGIMDTTMQDAVLERLALIRGTTVEAIVERRLAAVPLGRGAAPSECAGLIAFLLSDEAGYITGQAINQDGGMVTG